MNEVSSKEERRAMSKPRDRDRSGQSFGERKIADQARRDAITDWSKQQSDYALIKAIILRRSRPDAL